MVSTAVGDDQGDRADPAAVTAPQTLAEKLDRCYTTMHPKDRKPYTYREVAAGMAELGVKVSPSYLWHLRKGERTNPALDVIQAMAKFFHVPAAYFLGEDEEVERIDAQMAVVRAMRHPGVRDVALRAGALSPAGLRAMTGVLRELEELQGITHSPDKGQRRRSTDQPQSPPDEEQ